MKYIKHIISCTIFCCVGATDAHLQYARKMESVADTLKVFCEPDLVGTDIESQKLPFDKDWLENFYIDYDVYLVNKVFQDLSELNKNFVTIKKHVLSAASFGDCEALLENISYVAGKISMIESSFGVDGDKVEQRVGKFYTDIRSVGKLCLGQLVEIKGIVDDQLIQKTNQLFDKYFNDESTDSNLKAFNNHRRFCLAYERANTFVNNFSNPKKKLITVTGEMAASLETPDSLESTEK